MDFETAYDEVFDDYGNVKACGRTKTRLLISACKKEDPNMDYGDMRTGFMNIGNIKKLYNRVKSKTVK